MSEGVVKEIMLRRSGEDKMSYGGFILVLTCWQTAMTYWRSTTSAQTIPRYLDMLHKVCQGIMLTFFLTFACSLASFRSRGAR